ncbi:MAG TPA: acetyl-CoA carboxylase biotin carboxyl carrier protein subunit [Streptosporangiaceae bacterium]|nr:acetyl-CoA carboxylase biotin carboxyl carrier protein subunit [Streptosporangiaceae bacterium]
MNDSQPDPPAPRPSALDSLCRSALALLDSASRTPSRLRLESDGSSVEIEWPAQEPGRSGTTSQTAAMLPPGGPSEPQPAAGVPAEPAEGQGDAAEFYVHAPTLGTFYRSPEPGSAPFVQVGDLVEAGKQVGIVEVMKLMTPVEADRPGRVAAILVADAAPVEHGQPLIACVSHPQP